ncbi:growth-blocking peptide, long form-like [Helicoverpa zea]|uniref:growth-blocking peptide, long form-like n=1 Tax=Helicoverpa zea TaxID=7113 RepID=UPI001F57D7E1|nr:growth-blocking peptide, long form-like [Helicoverpa zea]
MKLTISILFCVILTLPFTNADGPLSNFFGRIHNSVHQSVQKVREDVHNVLHPNDNVQQGNTDESIHFVEEESKEDLAATVARQQAEVTPAPTTSTTTPQSGAVNTTTEGKDGRENFAGGCIPGYMRTADGRCKPTY